MIRSHLALAAALGLAFALDAGAKNAPHVVLDPGHGGTQEGAIGPNALKEKDLCLAIARKAKALLEKSLHAEVTLTRDEDALIPLPERVDRANHARPDVFVSIHANSMPTRRLRARAAGIETYFLSAAASGDAARQVADRENADVPAQGKRQSGDVLAFILSDLQQADLHADASRLAYAIHGKVVAATGAADKGVQQAPFYVLTGVSAPSVLIEVGFISHPEESRKLSTAAYQGEIARGIADGVAAFLRQVELKDARAQHEP